MISKSTKSKRTTYLLLLFLLFTRFFSCVFISLPNGLLTMVMAYFVIGAYKQYSDFKLPILLYTLSVFCSCISSYIYRGQTQIYTVFFQSFVYTSLCFYFVCKYYKFTVADIEDFFIKCGLLSVGLYILQNAIYPYALFQGATWNFTSEIRIRMAASLLYSVLVFMGINKYMATKEYKYLIYSFLGLIPIIFMGFRSLIASLVVAAYFVIVSYNGISKNTIKYTLLFLIFAAAVSQIGFVEEKIQEMIARQDSGQTFDNEDYIRFVEFEFYQNSFFTNDIERFWGAGLPVVGTNYFQQQTLNFNRNLYWNDWGIVGLSWIFGIPTVVSLVYIYIKVLICKIPKDFLYMKAIFVMLILSSVTTAEIFRPGNLIVQGMILYLIEKVKIQKTKS